jgi:uncharacterized cysteine cluster protein YcgN (CxxCxxCC family)
MLNDLDQWLFRKDQEWESLCTNCGACCGSKEDPCENLAFTPDGRSYCRVYAARFDREHRTISGAPVRCVPIRNKLHSSWPGDEACGYKKRH